MPQLLKTVFAALLICLATACTTALRANVEAALANPDQTGIRWGMVVADMDGTERFVLNGDNRFVPASNTKIITTLASYHHLEALSAPALNPGTRVVLEPGPEGAPPNLILVGGGDAMLSDAPDCAAHCLAELADLVAAQGVTEIGHVIGDDSFFPFERWGVGWGLEDVTFYYGTAISALSLNDNLVWVDVTPGPTPGAPAEAAWREGDVVFALTNQIMTGAADSRRQLRIERFPGGDELRLYGAIPAGASPVSLRLAIENPAEIAAQRFADQLGARGITVAGVKTRHRELTLADEPPNPDDPSLEAVAIVQRLPAAIVPLAHLPGSPLRESVKRISKDSETLHADIALRRLGRLEGTGSRTYGVAALERFLEEAGLPETAYAVHGGSGLSAYNRISPRAMVQVLAFAAQQDWFEDWRADQPIGGMDGTLDWRFKGTILEGKIFAKTGTLNGTNALSGMMIAASGRPLLFSIFANDRPATTRSAVPEMDAALVRIAEAY